MLAATFKSTSGFYETGNTKVTVTIKRPRTGGLLISQREEGKEPKKNICNNVLGVLASGSCHGCQTTFLITLFSLHFILHVCAPWSVCASQGLASAHVLLS